MNTKQPIYLRAVISFIIVLFLCIPASAKKSPEKTDQQIKDSVNVLINNAMKPAMHVAPVTELIGVDKINDGGKAITIAWKLSADDEFLKNYIISKSESQNGPFEKVGEAVRGNSSFTDSRTTDGVEYYYSVVGVRPVLEADGSITSYHSDAVIVGPVVSSAQWFHMGRFWCLLFVIVISAAIIFYIERAKSGADIYVRKIAGIDAVDEAVGRATEMGKKIFFIPGIQDMNDVQTIAGIAILGRVGELAAQYETMLEVPVSKSLVMVTARETLKEAYTKVGRPDSFNENQVHYLTDDQFGYAAAIDGMVVREKPATIFYMGAFFAESLILAETGNAAGAIQIAGTAMPSQLPFFVASCDYTLIGEELFAASAYLSKEPRQLGSLKGQDFGKLIFLVAIIIGAIIETFTNLNVSQYFFVE